MGRQRERGGRMIEGREEGVEKVTEKERNKRWER